MAEDKGQGGAAAAIEDEEPAFDAPERGLRGRAARRRRARAHRRDAPLHGARHGRGGARPVPGREAGHRPRDPRRLLLRLRPAAPARRPATSRRSRAGCASRSPPTTRSSARRSRGRTAARSRSRRASRSRWRSSTTSRARRRRPARRCRRPASTSTARSATCARAPTSSRPGRSARSSCSPSPARTGGATRSARCSSGSTARSGRRRRSSTSTCTGARRRRSATTASWARSSTCSRSTTSRPGSAFWHPKGQRIWRTLEGAMRELQDRRGYQEVSTPIVVSERLWRQSGHWDHYAENMFIVESEGQQFSLKPMNCPESTFIYRSHLRSYRDLPLRFSEFGRLHRNERSGALSGLTRVRQFIQDDAHVYVRPDQLTAEIEALRRRGPRVVRLVRPRAAVRVRDPAGQGDRRPGAVGPRRGADQGRARPGGRRLRGQAQGRDVLRAQDRHLHRRRAGPRVADGDDPDRPHDAARAVRPDLHRRGRHGQAADGDPPRDPRLARAVHRDPRRALRRARSRCGSRRSRR